MADAVLNSCSLGRTVWGAFKDPKGATVARREGPWAEWRRAGEVVEVQDVEAVVRRWSVI